jgi:uncharacterized protein (TIGR00369 family)
MNEEEKRELLQRIMDNLPVIPYNRLLGLEPGCFDLEQGCIRFDMRPEYVGNVDYGILHGGLIASLFDIEGGFLLVKEGVWHSRKNPAGSPPKVKGGTIDLHVDYLRPGEGKQFVVTGKILRRGNKVAVISCELRNEKDDLLAVATGTYLIG